MNYKRTIYDTNLAKFEKRICGEDHKSFMLDLVNAPSGDYM